MTETNRQQLYSLVYEVVREIPAGKVATYGQIATLIGLPRHARHVGFALAHLSDEHNVPWHRVVNSKGELHQRHKNDGICQRELLESEGISFTLQGRVDLTRCRW